jgi:AraC-like DNA-binding protein
VSDHINLSGPLFPLLTRLPGQRGPDLLPLNLEIGIMVAHAVATAVDLGLPDVLGEEPETLDALAQITHTHAPSLYVLLRALCGIGIFTEVDVETHTFAHTERSRLLRSSAMADLVRLWSAPYQWEAWQDMAYTIQTGKAALEKRYGEGTTLWTYLTAIRPQESRTFQRGLVAVSNLIIPAILDAYDFSAMQHLVDVGGGHGSLVLQVLHRYPDLVATLFDRPPIIEEVSQDLAELPAGVVRRFSAVAGDFFAAVPAGADGYVLKNVLMDWSDEEYVRLLQNCRRAMGDRPGRLLVIEPVIGDETPFTKFFSLHMAIMMRAARHRTQAEHQALFAAAGWSLVRAQALGLEQMLLEGRPAEKEDER